MEPTPPPLTLTVEQAAKVLGIGRSTAYELVHTGDIPSLRLGRRIVVPIAKLAERLGATASDIGIASESPVKAGGGGSCGAALTQDEDRPRPDRRSDAHTLF